jgi:hypothetical protein
MNAIMQLGHYLRRTQVLAEIQHGPPAWVHKNGWCSRHWTAAAARRRRWAARRAAAVVAGWLAGSTGRRQLAHPARQAARVPRRQLRPAAAVQCVMHHTIRRSRPRMRLWAGQAPRQARASTELGGRHAAWRRCCRRPGRQRSNAAPQQEGAAAQRLSAPSRRGSSVPPAPLRRSTCPARQPPSGSIPARARAGGPNTRVLQCCGPLAAARGCR